jgi:hypothetical protein
LQGLEKALGVRGADDDAGDELAEGPVRKKESEIEEELLPRMADGG